MPHRTCVQQSAGKPRQDVLVFATLRHKKIHMSEGIPTHTAILEYFNIKE